MLEAPVPVYVLTGFLGSGKTTVLRHLLGSPEMARAAIVINEFGAMGLDQLLVGRVDDATVLLENGCVCCSLRDDLAHTLRQLFVRRASGEVPSFDRIVIETTGLAEPGAVARCLIQDQLLADCCRLGSMSATLDAVNGEATLSAYAEARRQVAIADRILLTKSDLVSAGALAKVAAAASALNPAAAVLVVTNGEVDSAAFFSGALYEPGRGAIDVHGWMASDCLDGKCGHLQHMRLRGASMKWTAHQGIRSFPIILSDVRDWRTRASALRNILKTHGPRLLRIKGILAASDRVRPIVVHVVQGFMHPPVELDEWPSADRRSRLVFITDGVEQSEIEGAIKVSVALDGT